VLIFSINFLMTLRRPADAGDDPWDAFTLEWATSSPPPPYDFVTVPEVRSSRPLWDVKHPDLADWKRGESHG
jgi:cytochrome c oxidase subunit 1